MVSVCLPSDALLQYLPSYLGFSYLGVSTGGLQKCLYVLGDFSSAWGAPSQPGLWITEGQMLRGAVQVSTQSEKGERKPVWFSIAHDRDSRVLNDTSVQIQPFMPSTVHIPPLGAFLSPISLLVPARKLPLIHHA